MENLPNGQLLFMLYYIVLNSIAYISMYNDKQSAINNRHRIPEKTLFKISILGGSLGVMIAMVTLQHKIKKQQFYTKIPRHYLITHLIMVYTYIITFAK